MEALKNFVAAGKSFRIASVCDVLRNVRVSDARAHLDRCCSNRPARG